MCSVVRYQVFARVADSSELYHIPHIHHTAELCEECAGQIMNILEQSSQLPVLHKH